ncbi:MAG: acyl--CoA ligase, partial [Variibacter sp.]|nr:acyl--CoA ligase [Variibacter sp.]
MSAPATQTNPGDAVMTPLDVLRSYRPHDYSLADVFDSRMEGNDRPFVVFRGRSWSYPEFKAAYLATARVLTARGIRPGDRVGLMARNNVGHVLLLFACARIGAILVPTNPELGSNEVGYVFKHAGVSGAVCDRDLLPVVRAAYGADAAPWMLLLDAEEDGAPDLMRLITEAKDDIALPPPAGADDTCVIIYTSGTTGFPKGAMHSQRNFVTSGEANVARLWLQPADRLLTVLPLFHVNALFYSLA